MVDSDVGLASQRRLLRHRLDQPGGLCFAAPPGREDQRAVGWDLAPGRLPDRVPLLDQCCGDCQVAGERAGGDATVERQRKHREHAGVARDPEPTNRHLLPRVIVPQIHRGLDGDPEPAERFLARAVLPGQGGQRPLQHRRACGVPLDEPRRQTVEEEIGGPPGMRLRRGQRGLRDLHQPTAAGQTAQIERRRERLQIRRPRQPHIERLEALWRPGAAVLERRCHGSAHTRPGPATGPPWPARAHQAVPPRL